MMPGSSLQTHWVFLRSFHLELMRHELNALIAAWLFIWHNCNMRFSIIFLDVESDTQFYCKDFRLEHACIYFSMDGFMLVFFPMGSKYLVLRPYTAARVSSVDFDHSVYRLMEFPIGSYLIRLTTELFC